MQTYNMNVIDKSLKVYKFTKTINAGVTGLTTQFLMDGIADVGYLIEKGRYYDLKYGLAVLNNDNTTYNPSESFGGSYIFVNEYFIRFAFDEIPITDLFIPDSGFFNWSINIQNFYNTENLRIRASIINTGELTFYCDQNTFTTNKKIIILLKELENISVKEIFKDDSITMIDYSI